MSTVGYQSLDTTGRPLYVSADGEPEYKTRGVTIDWSTVTAVSGSPVTLLDGTVIPVGSKYLRYGQVITRMGVAEVQTYTWTGGPTSGSAILTFPGVGEFYPESTVAIAYNATAAVAQAALQALPHIGPNGVTVARTGAGSNADPYVYTATFARSLGNVGTPTATNTFAGGTTPTVTIATTTPGVGTDKFGPYDDTASADGRATLSRGDCYILNQTHLESELGSDHPAAIEGGLLFKQRMLMTSGTHSLAAGPTITEVETAFPRVRWAE